MAVKTRMAVQCSEFYKRIISPYDFTIAIVCHKREEHQLSYILADEHQTSAQNLQVDPKKYRIIAYETPNQALK